MTRPFRMTPVYDLLLRGSPSMPIGLYQLHMATAAQLTRLHYSPGTLKAVKKRLKVLMDNDYVRADCIPTRFFRSPYYYTLGPAGIRYLMEVGVDVSASLRADKETNKHYLFIDHALELTDILIAALHLKLADPRFYLARFLHEREMKRVPFKVSQEGTRVSLIPDAFLDVRKRRMGMSDLSMPLVVEHDRGTEEQQHFKRRVQAYGVFLQSGASKHLFGVEGISVAFTTFVSARRVAQMREWTQAALAGVPQLASHFLFAELPRPLEPHHLLFERRWFTLQHEQPIALLGG